MLIEFLDRHLAVASRIEAERMTKTDERFWNVISISSPTSVSAKLRGAKLIHPLRFEDTEDARDSDAVAVPRREVISEALLFAQETAPEGLLIHCALGWSRSTAVALVILVQKLWPDPRAFERATETLLMIRPQSRPNVLIAELGFGCFMSPDDAKRLAGRVATHEPFVINRTETSTRSTHQRMPYDF